MNADSALLSRLAAWASPAREADWSRVYEEQLPRIYNYFRYRVGADEAEDLTSVTFEKAWRGRNRYRRDLGAFTTWLFAIARNVAIDHYRRRVPLEPLDAAAHVAAPGSPEEDAERASNAARLAQLLSTLGERERELIALRYGSGLTNRSIAKLSGLSESNVGTILHRAIGDLRSRWPGEG
ncbi:MAG: sigma-70 family RNA polymerase sigma factor [Candidatus Eisenbacteria bacterium]